jgi:signal transduction histidine kinase
MIIFLQNHTRIECNIDNTKNEWICNDRTRLMQILINLLANALKFTFKGHITLKVEREDQFLRFSVSDTGIGMIEE